MSSEQWADDGLRSRHVSGGVLFVDLVGSFFIFEMTKWEIKNGEMEMMMLIERRNMRRLYE